MDLMTLTLSWRDVSIRLAVALVAGLVVGVNRGEHGKAAGLRTTLLVCLAACIAMLQVNMLLLQAGKPANSFVVLDLMRLPLGILSGVGFIGAGVILRRDGIVTGVTTAATMWFVTVIGLCAGGGQIALAVTGLLLAMVVLLALGVLEKRLPRNRRGWLTLEYDRSSDARTSVIERFRQQRCSLNSRTLRLATGTNRIEECFEVRWRAPLRNNAVEHLVGRLMDQEGHVTAWSAEQ